MVILVVGASGATGRLLVAELLQRGHRVKAVVRSPESLPEAIANHDGLEVIQASVLQLGEGELVEHVRGCDAVASCLGHNLSFRGIFGPPHRLVTDATSSLCAAIKKTAAETPTRFVLMNTTGNNNRDLQEPISFRQKSATALMRLLLPPHVDNEQAADYLRTEIGQNDELIQWTAVRPDDLINEDAVSDYEVCPSPLRDAIFDAGKTSRINVAHFMADLATDDEIWQQWRGQMPVIYNKS